VPAVPYANPNNYVKVSGRLAERLAASEPNGAIWANQFDNVANRQAHVETTGPEIWEQTGGRIDGFICAVGTGGTLAGVGIALKERNPRIAVGLADPMGAALYSYYTRGELTSAGSSITEGIGQGRITGNLQGAPVDAAFQIPDEEALPVIFDLLEREGLCLGGSSGINVAGAIRLAGQLGPGHTVVTVLCDHGARYQSKLFNPEFLRSKNLPVPHGSRRPAASIRVSCEMISLRRRAGSKHLRAGCFPREGMQAEPALSRPTTRKRRAAVPGGAMPFRGEASIRLRRTRRLPARPARRRLPDAAGCCG
jgi:cysteine synthase A